MVHLDAMGPDPKIAFCVKQPLTLKQQSLIQKAKEASKNIHEGKLTLDGFKQSDEYLKLPRDLREPLLAEIDRQAYLNHGTELNTGVPWGVSVTQLLKANKVPAIQNQTLDLSNLHIANLDGLQTIASIATVMKLDLSNNQINTIQPHILARAENVRILYLSGNKLTTIADNTFEWLKQLIILDLGNNQLKAICASAFIKLRLWELRLYQNKLKQEETTRMLKEQLGNHIKIQFQDPL